MIFIDLQSFVPDDDWLYLAWQLNVELKSKVTIAEKHQFIDDNRDTWGILKTQLPYNDKCWFSEAKESVSVYEIEHFRPIKATIRSASVSKILKSFQEEPRKDWLKSSKYRGQGYWWLAFEYINFRNCGKRINNIKGNRFPICRNSFIAYSENDDHTKEEMLLLDPTKEGDPDLLTFDPDGKAQPTFTDQNCHEYIRAFTSIEIYGLNKIDALVKHRETKWKNCYKAIKRAANKYGQLEVAIDEGRLEDYYNLFDEFIDFINDIVPEIHPTSEFSAVAKSCVLSYTKYNWINEFVLKS